ncbi:hypothetical protein RJ640_021207 [Escallonia rubra]|uniref:BAH domain-containing protein n=1 Tax=Escallonia rubra TaxID=112253 RepID=A0AA88R878_9ASTE|nr:hypothetical protein RJ640_021207 [Escallonia rubra]
MCSSVACNVLPSSASTTDQGYTTMSHLMEAKKEDDIEFRWGCNKRIGGPNKDIQFFDSFTYDGVEYYVYDCVYMWRGNEAEPDIGKLVKMWETASHKKRVNIVWFFRPIEVRNWLEDVELLENEIFLASGEGKGLLNHNPLEAICGKCNVVCISKDKRNPLASGEDIRMADYVFYRTFDVTNCRLSERFPDRIAGKEVENFFNRRKYQKLITQTEVKENFKERAGKIISSSKAEGVAAATTVRDVDPKRSSIPEKERKIAVASSPNTMIRKTGGSIEGTEARKISCDQWVDRGKVDRSEDHSSAGVSDVRPPKKRKLQSSPDDNAKFPDPAQKLPDPKGHLLDAKDSVFEKRGLPKGVSFGETTGKVLDKRASELVQKKSVKTESQIVEVTQRPATSRDAAEFALSKLNKICLMLGGVRPVVGRKGTPRNPGKLSKFVGHLVIEKNRNQRQREEVKNAVSTSHYSQANTIEYEMATEWRALQEKSNLWWDALNEKQAEEIITLRRQLKIRRNA